MARSAARAPSHVLFDFFGTLVRYSASRTEQGYPRSHALLRAAGSRLGYGAFLALWSEVSAAFDARAAVADEEFSMAELGEAFLARAVPGGAGAAFADRFVATYVAEWNRGVRDLPGVPGLLAQLAARHRLAVLTNTHDPRLVPAHLERMGVAGHFERVFTSVEHGRRKPHPAIFRDALGALGAEPAACVYVGDTFEADYEGARAVGMRALLVDPEGRSPVSDEDRLRSILELPTRLGVGGG